MMKKGQKLFGKLCGTNYLLPFSFIFQFAKLHLMNETRFCQKKMKEVISNQVEHNNLISNSLTSQTFGIFIYILTPIS